MVGDLSENQLTPIEIMMYWWKPDKMSEGRSSFSTEPLFLVKWQDLTYNEVSWEPYSLLKNTYLKKIERFFKNLKVK